MADTTTLARPYAKAVFETARAANALGNWASSLQVAATAAGNKVVQRLIRDPNVENDTLKPLFAGPDGDEPEGYGNFIALLTENDRLTVLPEIVRLFEELRAEAERTMSVTVRSAVDLSPDYRERLREKLGQRYNRKIELDVVIDDDMLGGAIIQAGDQVIDGSLRRQLNMLAETLKA